MSVIPCKKNIDLRKQIEKYAETLKTEAHKLGNHGLSEADFYNSGLFRGAIERIRGQFSATMREKREFVQYVPNHMQHNGFIQDWKSAGEANRHDYAVKLNSGRMAIIELKGCLDGNNTNIFERPPHAQEFIIWSVCTNPGADPRRNAWSGIHTRLSAEIIFREQRIDGVIFWDMVCSTIGRPCPKVKDSTERLSNIGPFQVPPPCIYVLPSTIPSPRNNPHPPAQRIEDVQILKAFNNCFEVEASEINHVDFQVQYHGADIQRTTTVTRNGKVQRQSKPTAIRRT
jgi:hypothetical protein